jgi:hypothetical protein
MTRGEPLYFGPEARPLFGWLHRAPAPARLALAICNPFGYEAICTHRVLRHFAQAAAAAGVPALRFEYDGTGNSAGDDRDPERLASWVASVGHAVDALRASTASSTSPCSASAWARSSRRSRRCGATTSTA